MTILGINAYHGDSSAALFTNGSLQAAVEEERFNRIKHWAGMPETAIRYCLAMCDHRPVEHVAISRDPSAHFWKKVRRVATRPSTWASALARTRNLVSVSGVMTALRQINPAAFQDAVLHTVEHHRSHLASAFFASPFDEAAVVSVDGFGDFSSAMWGVGMGNRIEVRGSVQYPHSLGLFYTAFTQFLGFPKYGDEYKMMGLSAYGTPSFVQQVRDVIHTEGDQFRLSLDYFNHEHRGITMTWTGGEPVLEPVFAPRMVEVFGPPRAPRSELTQRDMDLAASVQVVLEENYFALLNYVQKQTGQRRLCLAGGVALNCVANGMIFQRTDFREVYVQPAAHDAGTSIGAALYAQHQVLHHPREYTMRHVYYGPGYTDSQIRDVLDSAAVTYHQLSEDELIKRSAQELANGQILGWFQGRMEFGPRALGNRSILADPRRPDMKDTLNARIKYREPFRPFCPSILAERVDDYFEISYPSPFMVMAYKIKPHRRAEIPAVTHGDGTGRLQTVERDVNPRYWKLIDHFAKLTGVPVLLNTSFNENEPIVNTPREALDCFLRTRMDVLVLGSYILYKSENLNHSAERRAFAEAK